MPPVLCHPCFISVLFQDSLFHVLHISQDLPLMFPINECGNMMNSLVIQKFNHKFTEFSSSVLFMINFIYDQFAINLSLLITSNSSVQYIVQVPPVYFC